MKLHHLKPAEGSKTERTRVGRGRAGARGKTAGRGTKGTGARKNVPAYFEGGQIEFSYPPTYRTFQETLREVHRCTRENIRINTFMMERGRYLTDFVDQMTRINRGRAFYATPDRLGEYILVDYVDNKRKTIR